MVGLERTQAADSGMPDAQVRDALEWTWRSGQPARRRELFEKAAAAGRSGAMFALGVIYAGGDGNEPDRSDRSERLPSSATPRRR